MNTVTAPVTALQDGDLVVIGQPATDHAYRVVGQPETTENVTYLDLDMPGNTFYFDRGALLQRLPRLRQRTVVLELMVPENVPDDMLDTIVGNSVPDEFEAGVSVLSYETKEV